MGIRYQTFIPPLLALAAVGLLVGNQHRKVSEERAQSRHMRSAVAAAQAQGMPKLDPIASVGATLVSTTEAKETAEPLTLADLLNAKQQDERALPDFKKLLKIQQGLRALTAEQVGNLLAELQVKDVKPEERRTVENMLLDAMLEKDAKLTLEAALVLSHHGGEETWHKKHTMGKAFSAWSKQDPAAALAWLDEEAASGRLEGKELKGSNALRLSFEREYLESAMLSDRTAALARLNKLSEADRADLLSHSHEFPRHQEAQQAFLAMAESLTDSKKRLAVLRGYGDQLGQTKLEELLPFLRSAKLEPAQIQQCMISGAEAAIRARIWNTNDMEAGKRGMQEVKKQLSLAEMEDTGKTLANIAKMVDSGSPKFTEEQRKELKAILTD